MPAQQVIRPLRTMWRPEYIETISCPTINTEYNLSSNGGQLPRDRYLSGLLLTVSFRVTNAAANNPTAVLADAPYSIIDRVTVMGKHQMRRSDETIVSLSGSELAQLQLFNSRNPIQGSGALVTTANATNDIRFVLFVPFVPMRVHPREQANYLLDGPNYQNLYLKIKWADSFNIFSGQTAVSTFSAFGSTGGAPTIDVAILQAMEPQDQLRGYIPGLYQYYSRPANSGALVTTASTVRIADLPRGGRLRRILVKTGVLATTGVAAGNQAYATLSDSILSKIKVFRGTNRPVLDYNDFVTARGLEALFGGGQLPGTGYLNLDWVRTGSFQELFNATGLIAGPSGDVDFFLSANVTGAANQAATLIVEEVSSFPTMVKPA